MSSPEYHRTRERSPAFKATADPSMEGYRHMLLNCQVLGCNDDALDTFQSQLFVPLTAGQTVVVVVDGYGGAQGSFTLNAAFIP